jgi:penicillin-insensitive murein endopeptidase
LTILRLLVGIIASIAAAGPSLAQKPAYPSSQSPAPGPLRIIGGGPGGGCIAGAVSLPGHGPGFQTIHLDRSAFYGAPQTIARLETLAQQASAAGLPPLLVEDISLARGGPMPGGHMAHQTGLDADIGLDMRPRGMLDSAQRQSIELTSMVRPDQRGIDPSVWSPRVALLLKLAAELPDVDRVLVNPAIKRQLCEETTGDRSWLRRIRPWYGHAAHMHIHFRCPADQATCQSLAPPPPGDGCDASLQWWFDRLDHPPPPPTKPTAPAPRPPPMPEACRAIFSVR